jgi:DNA repair exonuclease SbcCD ATPase subunit
MDREALKKDIEAVVASIWSEKEEVEVRKKTEEALQKSADTITELTVSLEDKEVEFTELSEKNTANETEIQKLKTELEAAQKKVDESKEALTASEKIIENMKKDKAAELRMTELEELKVAHSDKDVQMSKVRDLSEEDFATYKDELVSLRKAVEDELAKTKKSDEELAEAKKKEDELAEAKKKEDELAEAKKKEEELAKADETQATEIGPGHMALAALNLETKVTDEMSEQYQKMGKAMAALWTEKKE